MTAKKSFDVINPATGEPFAKCYDASKEQLDDAVAAAAAAFPKVCQFILLQ